MSVLYIKPLYYAMMKTFNKFIEAKLEDAAIKNVKKNILVEPHTEF